MDSKYQTYKVKYTDNSIGGSTPKQVSEYEQPAYINKKVSEHVEQHGSSSISSKRTRDSRGGAAAVATVATVAADVGREQNRLCDELDMLLQKKIDQEVINRSLATENPTDNIMLMTDGYKFSHYRQYPVSWTPETIATGTDTGDNPVVLNENNYKTVFEISDVYLNDSGNDGNNPSDDKKLIRTPTTDCILEKSVTEEEKSARYIITTKDTINIVKNNEGSEEYISIDGILFDNIDHSKLRKGAKQNKYRGAYNVSYFTGRDYKIAPLKDMYKEYKDDDYQGAEVTNVNRPSILYKEPIICFFGLQYYIKRYLKGPIITAPKVEEARQFIMRYMADVRRGGPPGFDDTMFPYNDWMAIATGDYSGKGNGLPDEDVTPGVLPIEIHAIPEGTIVGPNTAYFTLVNTHPRFYWMPNFLETLLVQVWYPMTVATSTREQRKIIQAFGIITGRRRWTTDHKGTTGDDPEKEKYDESDKFTLEALETGQVHLDITGINPEKLDKNMVIDSYKPTHRVVNFGPTHPAFITRSNQVHNIVPQVFDLLDFGFRGVSSSETAALGGSAYLINKYEGSDTVVAPRLLTQYYDAEDNFNNHGMTSIPASEHSTVTSWSDHKDKYAEFGETQKRAFENMVDQYDQCYGVACVSDGFNIWDAIKNLWGDKLKDKVLKRMGGNKLMLIRPDSGEPIESVPQLLKFLEEQYAPKGAIAVKYTDVTSGQNNINVDVIGKTHAHKSIQNLLNGKDEDAFYNKINPKLLDALRQRYNQYTKKIPGTDPRSTDILQHVKFKDITSPFTDFSRQRLRILQGDGIALDTLPKILASMTVNGFASNTVHFGSGGGLLQKVNRDSFSCAFKCCAMLVVQSTTKVPTRPRTGTDHVEDISVKKKSYRRRKRILCWKSWSV